jgi:alcohol dehydrogenase class IV
MNDRDGGAAETAISPFIYEGAPVRVVFGSGTRSALPAECDSLRARNLVLVSTPDQEASARDVVAGLGERVVAVLPIAAMHTPFEVTEQALKLLKAVSADAIVAVGGGSTIGLSKALSVRTGLPQIVLPTTYAGSENTPLLGETQDGQKTTRSAATIRPRTVIYDVDLTLTLPAPLSCTSGINAMAHAVEALYAVDANPITSLMAEEAVASLASALPGIVVNPKDIGPRSSALYGAWLAGTCLGSVGMALHHKLCHVLGGSFALPHAETHTVVLPHALAFNAPCAPQAVRALRRALGVADPALGIFELEGRLGVSRSLRELGMKEDDLGRAADLVVANAYRNPRPIERDIILALLRSAWAGEPPVPIMTELRSLHP